jgi:predicted membrane protein
MIFGGGEIDLSKARTTEKEIDLEITAIFGGAKLIIPQNWKVNSKGTAIIGGYDNKTNPGAGDVALNIKGTAIFGGIEIAN